MKKLIVGEDGEFGIFFFVMFALGWAVIFFGAYKLVTIDANNWKWSTEFGLGLNIFHDAIIAPVACVFGFATSKVIRNPAIRRPINWGIFTTAVAALIDYPSIRGFGKKADNPTLLPWNYAHSMLIVSALIWAIVVVVLVSQAISTNRQSKALASK